MKPYKMRSYTALIYGRFWSGGKGHMEHQFGYKPSRADVLKHAGDFQEVTRIQLLQTDTVCERCRFGAVQS
jgi:hypothetical protein